MSRSTALVFVVLGAAVAGFAFSSATGRFEDKKADAGPSVAASPQTATLDWRESYGKPGEELVFGVEKLQVTENGWRAWLVLTNGSSIAYDVGDPRATLDRAFGLMLFRTGDEHELEHRNQNGILPATRPAVRYVPNLPKTLVPGATWRGRISAPGALVARSWVRVVFGTLVAVGKAPSGLSDRIVWITDHAYQLKARSPVRETST